MVCIHMLKNPVVAGTSYCFVDPDALDPDFSCLSVLDFFSFRVESGSGFIFRFYPGPAFLGSGFGFMSDGRIRVDKSQSGSPAPGNV